MAMNYIECCISHSNNIINRANHFMLPNSIIFLKFLFHHIIIDQSFLLKLNSVFI